jgi:hypothetical protein
MNIYQGKCDCGEVQLTLSLPKPISEYKPRACDCDYCMSKGAAYVSDPKGRLNIRSEQALLLQRQGSNQASFVNCKNCKMLIAASINIKGKMIGAVNVITLKDKAMLANASVISPKLLNADDKLKRWQACWLKMEINSTESCNFIKQTHKFVE